MQLKYWNVIGMWDTEVKDFEILKARNDQTSFTTKFIRFWNVIYNYYFYRTLQLIDILYWKLLVFI